MAGKIERVTHQSFHCLLRVGHSDPARDWKYLCQTSDFKSHLSFKLYKLCKTRPSFRKCRTWNVFFSILKNIFWRPATWRDFIKRKWKCSSREEAGADSPDIIRCFYLSRNKYFIIILFQITCWSIVCQRTITVGSLVVSYLNSDTAAATNSFLFGKHTIKLTFDFSVCLSTPWSRSLGLYDYQLPILCWRIL